MSDCENIDGQCADSWCDCDYQRRKRKSSFAASGGSLAHVNFEVTTELGNKALVLGDPNMPEDAKKALREMIDAACKSLEGFKLKMPENDAISLPRADK